MASARTGIVARAKPRRTLSGRAWSNWVWVEGRNVRIDDRFAAGDPTLYKIYADELVGLRPDAGPGGRNSGCSGAAAVTGPIPIVFVLTADPVGARLCARAQRGLAVIHRVRCLRRAHDGEMLACSKRSRRAAARWDDLQSGKCVFRAVIQSGDRSRRTVFGVSVTQAPVHDIAAIEAAVAVQARQPGVEA